MNKIENSPYLNYILTYLIVALTGVSVFLGDNILIIMFIISAFIFYYKGRAFDQFFYTYLSVFLLIIILQIVTFEKFEFNPFIGFFIRLFYVYFTLKIVGVDFPKYYVNIIYFFSIISLFLYVSCIMIPGFESFLTNDIAPNFEFYDYDTSIYQSAPQFIIFTINRGELSPDEFIRNSGPFWEPGAFSGFLIVALIFNLLIEQKIKTKKNILFILAIITTFSTTGYIAMFLLLIGFILIGRKVSTKLFATASLTAIFIFSFFNLYFLSSKIADNILYSQTSNPTYAFRTRLISAEVDIYDVINYPLSGRGRFQATRFDSKDPVLRHRNNGVTGLAAEFGVIGFIFYFFTMYKSFLAFCVNKKTKPIFALFIMAVIFTIGFSQYYFMKPFFIALSMLFILYKPQKSIKPSL